MKYQLFLEKETRLQESHLSYSHIYRAKKTDDFGLSADNNFVVGLTLAVVSEGNNYDSLKENIANIGAEFICHLPKEGLIEGAYYEAYEVCSSYDWETGYCDDTEVYIRRVL